MKLLPAAAVEAAAAARGAAGSRPRSRPLSPPPASTGPKEEPRAPRPAGERGPRGSPVRAESEPASLRKERPPLGRPPAPRADPCPVPPSPAPTPRPVPVPPLRDRGSTEVLRSPETPASAIDPLRTLLTQHSWSGPGVTLPRFVPAQGVLRSLKRFPSFSR
ncbi:vegetative cell wall protein gp1-like [Heterocephalus glaber]|uniref:Vegetative cell wall protein gp1-like n=1 Tax=Heterocephalus glaber TaxID=10181 RepID=A0AAX6TL18_HETGA|nr:vegetative cell wall protein gp1-like [Heterocephalus glaber]